MVRHGPVISRRGGEGLFADARLISAAFGDDVLKSGQNSEVIEIDDTHAVVLRLREHQPERQQEAAEVEPQIRAVLGEAIRREQAVARAESLLREVSAGATMEQLASRDSLEWQVALAHRRGASEVPREMSDAVFSISRAPGASSSGTVVLPAGDVVMFQTSNFKEGDLAGIPSEQQGSLRGMLAQSRGAATAAHYRERLRASADVELL